MEIAIVGVPAPVFDGAGLILGLEWPAMVAFGLDAVWSSFGLLYAAHTTLNLASHRGSRSAP